MFPEPGLLGRMLSQIRDRKPVIHVITNWVTAGDVANGLRAVGARPIMAAAPEEAVEIVSRADALVLNLGTPDPARITAMLLAGRHANRLGRPVVLDPVGAGASGFRREACEKLLSQIRISVIRGNQAEIGTLAGVGGELRGVDAAAGPADSFAAAESLSVRHRSVVAATGREDLVIEARNRAIVENGHPMMADVTGTGCMLSALIGAFAAVGPDPFTAAVGAVAFFGVAGERASLVAAGPGAFKAALFDHLFLLKPEELEAGARIRNA